ncbi:MAG TPA: hypothetical protein VHT96_06800 [Clostridia bacterium]|nr:hypothetical protein [Clostridia bacterium]
MKVTDITIAFILVILPFVLVLDYRTQDTELAIYKTVEMNKMIDAAVEDGTRNMFGKGLNGRINLDREKGYESFIRTMCLNLNKLDDELGRLEVEGYIPCIVALDYDGYYIMKHVEYTNASGESEIRLTWLPKQAYAYSDSNYVYSLTLGNDVTFYEKSTGNIEKGSVDQFIGTLPGSDLIMSTTSAITLEDRLRGFDTERRIIIIDQLKKDINEVINNHNDIAMYYGITYYFSLPTIEESEWLKTIDDVGLMVFFQGMPLGNTGERINKFALGGARILKGSKYFLDTEGTDASMYSGGKVYYYHSSDTCNKLKPASIPAGGYPMRDSMAECAKEGYFPCEYCN